MSRKALRFAAPTAAALLDRRWREKLRAAEQRGSPRKVSPVPAALLGSPRHLELEAVALLGSTRHEVTRAVEHFSGPGAPSADIKYIIYMLYPHQG